MNVLLRAMRVQAFRALCAAGLFAVAANGAQADSAAQKPLDITTYTTAGDFDSIAPRARLAGQFDIGPDALAELTTGFDRFSQTSVAGHLALGDDVALDFGTGSAAGSSPYDGLFLSPATAGYSSLTDGGSFLSSTFDVTDQLHLSLGESSLSSWNAFEESPQGALARLGGVTDFYDTRSAHSLLAGVSLDVAPWGDFGFTATRTAEHDGLLGEFDPRVKLADTSSLGVSARVQLGGGWMTTASFAQAITKLDLKPGFGPATDDRRTQSYGLAIAKRGIFGADTMGFSVSRPAAGANEFSLLSGDDARLRAPLDTLLLDAQSPETDFELGYVTTFLDGSIALQTNAAYQMNFAGQTGNNAVSFLSRAKIKF